jgi:hypothetical protein
MCTERCAFRLLELSRHFAGESGANQTSSRRDAVPDFGGENGAPNLRVAGNQMDFVTNEIAF